MPSENESPPHHVLSTKRLAMLTSSGAPIHRIENQIAGMLVAWATELGEDRSEFRDRLNELEENLQAGLENTEQAIGGDGGGSRTMAQPQIEALRAALAVVRAAQDRLGV